MRQSENSAAMSRYTDDQLTGDKKRILVLTVFAGVTIQLFYLNVASFVPDFLAKNFIG